MKISRTALVTAALLVCAAAVLVAAPPGFAQTGQRVHVVVKGDTLWDISSAYLYDPFLWPRVWNSNRDIENPHLIHPGQEIIIPAELLKVAVQPPVPEPAKPVLPPPPEMPEPKVVEKPVPPPPEPPEPKVVEKPLPVEKKQELIRSMATYGFIVKSRDFGIGTITSSEDNRLLIAPRDKVFVTSPKKKPLTFGEKYSIIKVFEEVRNPVTDRKVGFMARVLGDLSVVDVRDELATSIVGEVYRSAEIGDRVMEHVDYLSWVPKDVSGVEAGLEGTVLANPEGKTMMGVGDVFFLDLGLNQGLKPGDVLQVVRQKDKIKSPRTSKKLTPPEEIIGLVEVVAPREKTSVVRITKSYREIFVGARVVSAAR